MCKRSCQDPVTESGTEHNSSSPMYVMRSSFDFSMRCHFSHGRRLCASHWNETVPLFQMLLTVYSGMIFLNFFPCCFWYPQVYSTVQWNYSFRGWVMNKKGGKTLLSNYFHKNEYCCAARKQKNKFYV